jgi:hypothetical protein
MIHDETVYRSAFFWFIETGHHSDSFTSEFSVFSTREFLSSSDHVFLVSISISTLSLYRIPKLPINFQGTLGLVPSNGKAEARDISEDEEGTLTSVDGIVLLSI